ncbi:piggyBac transposable element-derived protein 4-like [Littorina saxatilis]
MEVPLPTDRTPLGYFTLFVDNVVIDRFVLETNKFAKQVKEHLPDFYYLKRWNCDTGTDSTETRKLIGILMAMGVVSKPTERSYWSTNSIMETPFFNKVMPRDRFLALFTFWHLNDNEEAPLPGSPDYDKLYKIQPFFSHLQERFSSVYYPEENMAVDESVMPWRGRVAWRQFIVNKPCRYGMKL